MQTYKVSDIWICSVKSADKVSDDILFFFSQIHVTIIYRTEKTSKFSKSCCCLGFSGLWWHEFNKRINIIIVIKHVIFNLAAEIVNIVQVCITHEHGFFIIRKKCLLYIFVSISKVKYKCTHLPRCSTVKSWKCLYCSNVSEFLVNIHWMKKWFIKTSLIFIGNNKNVISAAVKCRSEFLVSIYISSFFIKIEWSFCIWLFWRHIIKCNFTWKCDAHSCACAFIRVIFNVFRNCKIVFNGTLTTVSDYHSFALTIDSIATVIKEVFHNHFGLLADCYFTFLIIKKI